MVKRHVEITEIKAWEIIDSRGLPTIEVNVAVTDDGGAQCDGTASAPSDATPEDPDPRERRDGGHDRREGFGVERQIDGIAGEAVAGAVIGRNALDQAEIDGLLAGTELGAGATFALSMAVAKAAAGALRIPLFQHLGGEAARELPVPLALLFDRCPVFGELMLVPTAAATFGQALRQCAEVRRQAGLLLENKAMGPFSYWAGAGGAFSAEDFSTNTIFGLAFEAMDRAGHGAGEFGLALGSDRRRPRRNRRNAKRFDDDRFGRPVERTDKPSGYVVSMHGQPPRSWPVDRERSPDTWGCRRAAATR